MKTQRALVLENLALRHQVVMLKRSVKRARPSVTDRLFWIAFARFVEGVGLACFEIERRVFTRWRFFSRGSIIGAVVELRLSLLAVRDDGAALSSCYAAIP